MDLTVLICIIFLYIICAWLIGFNIISDDRFNNLEKTIGIIALFFPPIGIILFPILKISKRNKQPIKKSNFKKPVIYHGGYQGGHNKPKKNPNN